MLQANKRKIIRRLCTKILNLRFSDIERTFNMCPPGENITVRGYTGFYYTFLLHITQGYLGCTDLIMNCSSRQSLSLDP